MKGALKRSAEKRGPQAQPKRAKKRAAEEDGGGAFFLYEDDDDKKVEEEGVDDEEEHETADQLRLRLAQEYLSKVQDEEDGLNDRRGVTGGSDDIDDDEEDEEEAEDDERAVGATARARRLAERLQQDVAQVAGRLQRHLADRVQILAPGDEGYSEPCCSRGHRLAATAIALTGDDSTAFTVSKDGGICRWDVETMKRTQLYRPGDGSRTGGGRASGPPRTNTSDGGGADWVARKARSVSRAALGAVAVSSDGRYLAVGGGDNKVHVFEASSGTYLQGFPGHKDVVTGLAFRDGTHTLASCSADRTVKLWSLDDRAYMDTLYGHQAEVLGLDFLRAERLLTAGHDHSCRLWKIPEESQLIFRAHDRVLDCVRFVTATEWVSGGCDGGLHLWSHTRKKPMFVAGGAHGPDAGTTYAAPAAADGGGAAAAAAPLSPEHGWVTSVAVCRNADLVVGGIGGRCGQCEMVCYGDKARIAYL
ncbi:hypothetical protein Vretimale_13420 [Volvox reticuliferus]|uniref:Uncharacterized protein n=1 Tax=Volvox reticuliferus TaxID=1737510 RepID=A0A8J4LU16_9CHLO|nr:hypothetical protein Vretimale_13420 [Volvox reticuliferus]